MPAKPATNWYGVRTLFRFYAEGKPKRIDRYFDPDSTMVEDRVVLFQARDFAHAIKRAEKEATRYNSLRGHTNAYGQRVRSEILKMMDVFSINEEPGDQCEVYANMILVPRSVRNATLVNQRFGPKEKNHPWSRTKFVDAQIMEDAMRFASSGKRMKKDGTPPKPSSK